MSDYISEKEVKLRNELSEQLNRLQDLKPFKSDYDRAQWDALLWVQEILDGEDD